MSNTIRSQMNRRRLMQVLGASGAVAVAGCLGGDDDTDDTGAGTDDSATNTDDMSDDDHEDEQTDADDDEGDEDEDVADQPTLQRLVDLFDDQLFNDDQLEIDGERGSYTPAHVWKWVSEETFIALHLDNPNPEDAENLRYIVIGKKGVFTEESQPDEEFTHFHKRDAEGWEAGHGGDSVDDEGYWLTHIAVDDFEMPWGEVEVGVDYGFMPTPPEEGSEGTGTFEVGSEGSLSDTDRDALLELFADNWTNNDQREIDGELRAYTPAHVWWEPPTENDSDTIVFLHFDDPNPEEANDLIYFGMGQAGNFTNDDNPNQDDFSHFHKSEADSWDAGHGGSSADDEGYWLVHHAVRDLEMPWGDVDIGVDRNFMPTPTDD
ncbi:hypothetical protein OB919_03480 [Halobacteria archaeon AArc-curdl1]|uniref:Uncharacterized protein n=1 Tax=Natronosalvus hydrolyticus TaxID=2979988 RepID=A0AAP2Z5E0_9EURY|nr:hypothetical protein [Halobacteria archaeon AArc-curdl1]